MIIMGDKSVLSDCIEQHQRLSSETKKQLIGWVNDFDYGRLQALLETDK